MLLDLRTLRRTPSSVLFLATFVVLFCLLYLSHPYIGSVRSKFSGFSSTIESFRPAPDGKHGIPPVTPTSPPEAHQSDLHGPLGSAQLIWLKLQPLLDNNPPGADEIEGWDGLDFTSFDANATDYTEDVLKLSVMDIVRMRRGHRGFVDGIRAAFPDYRASMGTARRGIVTTAAGYYLPVFVVSLRMLRRTGTTLPVEVWMNTVDEYEPYICEQVLPAMNARCKILAHVFSHDDHRYAMKQEIESFQFKIFAILFSSFMEVLWLDADNFPLHEPEELFDAEPFKSTGMIVWPDFWFRAVSPTYYLINGKEPEHRGVRPALETGQMLLNKATHLQVLLLAAYYNYYGPSHYYGLLCQNAPGRGDKETFIPAATALDMPFYQVHQSVDAVGHENAEKDGIWIFAMIQYDPVQDFHRHSKLSGSHNDKTPTSQFDSFDDSAAARPFFLHCNTPKWNPKNVFDHVGVYDLTWDVHRDDSPAFSHPQESVDKLGGIERTIWEEVRWVACELEGKFADWEGRTDVCDKVNDYFDNRLDSGSSPEHHEAEEGQESTEEEGKKVDDDDDNHDQKDDHTEDEHLVMSDNGKVKPASGSNDSDGDTDKAKASGGKSKDNGKAKTEVDDEKIEKGHTEEGSKDKSGGKKSGKGSPEGKKPEESS